MLYLILKLIMHDDLVRQWVSNLGGYQSPASFCCSSWSDPGRVQEEMQGRDARMADIYIRHVRCLMMYMFDHLFKLMLLQSYMSMSTRCCMQT